MTIEQELQELMQTLTDEEAAALTDQLPAPDSSDRAVYDRIQQRVMARVQTEQIEAVPDQQREQPVRLLRWLHTAATGLSWIYAAAACLVVLISAIAFRHLRTQQPPITVPPDGDTAITEWNSEQSSIHSQTDDSVPAQDAVQTTQITGSELYPAVTTQTAEHTDHSHSVISSASSDTGTSTRVSSVTALTTTAAVSDENGVSTTSAAESASQTEPTVDGMPATTSTTMQPTGNPPLTTTPRTTTAASTTLTTGSTPFGDLTTPDNEGDPSYVTTTLRSETGITEPTQAEAVGDPEEETTTTTTTTTAAAIAE